MPLDRILDLTQPNTEIILDWFDGRKDNFKQFTLCSDWRSHFSEFQQHKFADWTVTRILALDEDRL